MQPINNITVVEPLLHNLNNVIVNNSGWKYSIFPPNQLREISAMMKKWVLFQKIFILFQLMSYSKEEEGL